MIELTILKNSYAYASLFNVKFKLFLKRVKRKVFFLKVNFVTAYLSKIIRPYSHMTINLSDNHFRSIDIVKSVMDLSDWTIVIQGPINSNLELDYLRQNLELLKCNYSGVKIVISSYHQCKKYIDQIDNKLYDQIILLNSNNYKNNFERQVASTSAGLEQSLKWGTPFSIKLRSDQILRNPVSLQLFGILLEEFKDAKTDSQTRIIFGSYNSWLYRPFGLSDMFTAGRTVELSKYWKFDDEITDFQIKFHNEPTWLENKVLFFESFLNMRFLNSYEFSFSEDKFKDTSLALRDYFIVVDSGSIGQEWLKRNNVWAGNSIVKAGYDLPPEALLEFNFTTWLLIKNNALVIRPNELASRY